MHKSDLFQRRAFSQNTVLNWHGVPQKEFSMYARAFHEAGRQLVNEKDKRYFRDFDACPIVFLYRHALELYLKAILLGDGRNILLLAGKPCPKSEEVLKGNHSLERMLPTIRLVFEEVGWDQELGVDGAPILDNLENLIKELSQIDPASYAFRYPIKKDGSPSVPDHFIFSVVEFAKGLDYVLKMLDGVICGLHEEWNARAEFAYEASHTEPDEFWS